MADIVKKTIHTRVTQKHDVEENWNKAENFIPKEGEIIIYDKDDNHSTIRIKVGDGITVVKSLPFITDDYYTVTEINGKLDGKQDKLNPGVNLIGTDGITIDKASDSEKIEISGKNLLLDPLPGKNNRGAQVIPVKNYGSDVWGTAFRRNTSDLVKNANSNDFVGYDNNGAIYARNTVDDDWSVVNKKYADENYLEKYKTTVGSGEIIIPAVRTINNVNETVWRPGSVGQYVAINAIACTDNEGHLGTNTPTNDKHCANKKYVDDAIVNKQDKFISQSTITDVEVGKSYELSTISSLQFTINNGSFTTINDVSQICFIAESSFDITIPEGSYLCVGDGLSSDKKIISCIANKVYYITIGYTPFGIEIVSSIDEIASENIAA